MKLISAQYSIVIVNPAITPSAAEAYREWQQFGKLTNKILIPPLFRAEIGANIAIQVPEGKVELIFKSLNLEEGFQKVKEIAHALLSAFGAFTTRAVGINLNGIWIHPDFNFEKWRKKIFTRAVMNKSQILTSEIKLGLKMPGFIRHLTCTEFQKGGEKGIQINVNNHFDLEQENVYENYDEVISKASEIIRETIIDVEKNWLTV